MRAYSELYVGEAQRKLGSMVDFGVNGLGLPLGRFYAAFLENDLSLRFGLGSPAVVAGVSGIDLALTIALDANLIEGDQTRWVGEAMAFSPVDGASPEYWTGWALAYYQWACGRSFQAIQELVPVDRIAAMYTPYHESDVSGFCLAMDALCAQVHPQTNLQAQRILAGLSQSQLAAAAGVPVRTIQQYEQRQKSINKAQAQYLVALAHALHCNVEDLLEYAVEPRIDYALVSL